MNSDTRQGLLALYLTTLLLMGTFGSSVSFVTVVIADTGGNIQYSDLQVSDTTVVTNEATDISATVRNDDDQSQSYTAELKEDGAVVATKTGTLAAGANTQITFTRSYSSTGTVDVTVDGLSAQTVTVQDPISYSGLSVSETTVYTDEAIDISATVRNDADDSRTYTAELEEDGAVVATKTGTLAAGANTQITFTRSYSSAGTVDVTVDDLSAQTVTVQDPISYSGLSVSDTTVATGESADISATLTNNDDQSQSYTAELEEDGSVVDTKSGTISASGNTEVTFSRSYGSTGTVDVTIDGLTARTIDVVEPIRYSGLSVSETTIYRGNAVDISATLTNNDDDSSRSYSADLKQDGAVVATESGSLTASANTAVSFSRTVTATGTIELTVDGLSPQTVTVRDPISYSGLSVSETDVTPGESVDVTATLTNDDSAAGHSYTAELERDGSIVATQTGTIAAGNSKTVTFTRSFASAGDYDLTIGGLAPKTVSVSSSGGGGDGSSGDGGDSDDSSGDGGDSDDGSGNPSGGSDISLPEGTATPRQTAATTPRGTADSPTPERTTTDQPTPATARPESNTPEASTTSSRAGTETPSFTTAGSPSPIPTTSSPQPETGTTDASGPGFTMFVTILAAAILVVARYRRRNPPR